ncbi:hypothetical protein AMJ85_07115 [candidate division BRC1 bacterium SM23_51]|nr:MAG: hypothetical protein AMJ85_07115 [candidate division BRC1 bacterium SM23_51]
MTTDKKQATALLEQIWKRNGAWRLSSFVQRLLLKARAKYPKPTSSEKAPWPSDHEGVAQNLTYLFPGHVMKLSKVLCPILGDNESLHYLSQTREFTVVDLACGAGMASIATIDFLLQLLKAGFLKRSAPLTVAFILNDLKSACLDAATYMLNLAESLVNESNQPLRVGLTESLKGSVTEIRSHLEHSRRPFDFLAFANAFDHVLIYGERVLEENPGTTDAIALARPCDRPALLADFFAQIGAYSNPYFSRALFLQEWRYSPLMPIALPSRELKVIRTRMIQEVVRPDVEEKAMPVRFCYCGCRYGFARDRHPITPELQPLPSLEDATSYFMEEEEIDVYREQTETLSQAVCPVTVERCRQKDLRTIFPQDPSAD